MLTPNAANSIKESGVTDSHWSEIGHDRPGRPEDSLTEEAGGGRRQTVTPGLYLPHRAEIAATNEVAVRETEGGVQPPEVPGRGSRIQGL